MAAALALVVSSVLLVAQGFDYLPWQQVCNSSDGSGKGLVGGDIVTRYVDEKGLPTVVMDNLENNVNVKCTSSKGDPRMHFGEVDRTPPVPGSTFESHSKARGSVNRTLWKKNVTRFWKVDKVIKCNPGTMQSCSMRVIEVKDGNWVKGNCTVVRQREGANEVMNCNIRDWVSNAMSARDTSACGKAGEDGSSMEKYFSNAEFKYSFRNPSTKVWTPCREFSEHSNGVEHKDEDVSHIKCNVTYHTGEHFLVRMEKTHHTPGSAALPMFGKSCKESAYFWVEGEMVEDDTHIKLPYTTVYWVSAAVGAMFIVLAFCGVVAFCRRHHYKHLYIREKSIKSQPGEDTEAFTDYKNNSGFDPNYREEEGGPTKSTSFTTTITDTPAPTPTKPEDQINPELAITDMPHLLPDFDPRMELPREQLKLGYFLGQGQFGRVNEGTATGLFGEHEDKMVKVAVKEIKDTQAEGWADELKILSNLAMHLNLVNLLGACTWPTSKPTYILLEYCSFGDLKKFLCKHKDEFESRLKGVPGNYESPYQATLLLRWSHDIAQGMKYLASVKIMHGDLAARNIMVGENFTAKVSDFGLSKVIPYYNEGKRASLCAILYPRLSRLQEDPAEADPLGLDGHRVPQDRRLQHQVGRVELRGCALGDLHCGQQAVWHQ